MRRNPGQKKNKTVCPKKRMHELSNISDESMLVQKYISVNGLGKGKRKYPPRPQSASATIKKQMTQHNPLTVHSVRTSEKRVRPSFTSPEKKIEKKLKSARSKEVERSHYQSSCHKQCAVRSKLVCPSNHNRVMYNTS